RKRNKYFSGGECSVRTTPEEERAAGEPWNEKDSASNAIDDQIIKALESFREHMSSGWPELGIPVLDPLLLPEVDLNITAGNIDLKMNLSDVVINNLSNFTIDRVHSNLLFLKVDIDLGLAQLDVDGLYDILGTIGVFPVFGEGPFLLDAFDLTFSVEVGLGRDEYDELGVTILTMYVDFENIMGGGDMADFVNGVLSSLAPDILQSLEEEYLPFLEEALKHEINTILHGGAADMTLSYVGEKDEVIWGGEIGLIDLQVDYTFRLMLALFGKELDYSLKMSFVHLSFETDVFLHQSELTFAYCNITELGPVHFKEKGAGPLDTPIYSLLVNTLIGELHGLVTGIIQGVICTLLEEAFASG
ncbi:putative hemolymph juvenile hormone binding protein JHBP-like 5, partial [Homarus americanus]